MICRLGKAKLQVTTSKCLKGQRAFGLSATTKAGSNHLQLQHGKGSKEDVCTYIEMARIQQLQHWGGGGGGEGETKDSHLKIRGQ